MKKLLLVLVVCLTFALNAFAAVNINTATQAELETLDGIGPTKAKAIIDYRKKNGPFKSAADLEKVDGIGPATAGKLRGKVSTSGASTGATPDKGKSDKAKEVGSTTAASSGKTSDSKTVKAPADKAKPAEVKPVGNETAAAAGKTADNKVVKETSSGKANTAGKPTSKKDKKK